MPGWRAQRLNHWPRDADRVVRLFVSAELDGVQPRHVGNALISAIEAIDEHSDCQKSTGSDTLRCVNRATSRTRDACSGAWGQR